MADNELTNALFELAKKTAESADNTEDMRLLAATLDALHYLYPDLLLCTELEQIIHATVRRLLPSVTTAEEMNAIGVVLRAQTAL